MAKRKRTKEQLSDSKGDLKALYAEMRRKFSAADLQKYTVIERGVPARQVLKKMEAIHRRLTRKRA
jgi:hypothetical protein